MVLEENDRDTIAACQRGDRDAFRFLFEAYQDKVYSIAHRYAGDRAVALDIAQETFLKLLSSIGEFRGDAGFETWLYRIVVNRCLDHRRRSRRIMLYIEDLFLRDGEDSALEGMLRVEKQSRVQRAVERLAPEFRIIVVLRYTEGLTYDQIAEIVGCPAGTVASRLNRAHKILEKQLSQLQGRRS